MTSNEIRASFLKYFERNSHRVVASSPLVPHEDPTLLFTNAGMNQFKDVFLGKEKRDYTRATTCQKCMRVSGKHNDLENVGASPSHHTFFQMLGNFSFGDYFKKEAIAFAWELLTGVWKIPAEKLYVTVFRGEGGIPRDEEARAYWLTFVSPDHLSELGAADNFWQMGETGPCGRCSEIYYFRGSHIPCPEPDCKGVECSCSRYVEIWNNVFMEFDRQADGALKPLPAPSIDTGMGLERLCAVLQGVESNYDTDLFTPILATIGEIAGKEYGRSTSAADISMRVIADHSRSITFLIADGVMPSNEGRGYVLRKIMRRAMRHGMRLGVTEPFLYRLVDVIVRESGDAYPELMASRDAVPNVIRSEEDRFVAVLADGLPKLEDAIERAASSGRLLPGDEAFKLYDTFGLPLDFIEDLAGERQVPVDLEGYERAMKAQREQARAKSVFKSTAGSMTWVVTGGNDRLEKAGDEFVGYAETKANGAQIVQLFAENGVSVDQLGANDSGFIALSRTPFYLEAGGQVSDTGRIYGAAGEAIVDGVARVQSTWPRMQHVRLTSGILRAHDIVTAEVDADRRDAIRRNHTATHLLHAVLRKVLGAHVKQAGSLVAPDRLRFDFVHHAPVKQEEVNEIERLVNEQIYRNTSVLTEERSTAEAISAGAMALFGEKYGDRVRVVSVPGFSMELCGGTHCRATGDVGFFTILSEGGVAAGVRRIEALTGAAAVESYQATRARFDAILGALGTTADHAHAAVQHLQAEAKRLARELSKLKVEGARGQKGQLPSEVKETVIAGVTLVTQLALNLEKAELRQLADAHRDRIRSGVVIIASKVDDRVSIVVSVSKDLAGRVHAGQIVKQIAPIVGGSGGGRPDFAEAGGKDASRVGDLLAESRRVVEEMLGK